MPKVIVFVIDGLRPDAITPDDTPTLFRLRAEGVDFTNGHAVFPTVTRVNAATLATGMQPGTHGIVGNQLYVPAVDPHRAFNTGEFRNLLTLDHAPTLADRLHARGLRFAGVSSGSTGSAFLLNPRAPEGVGVLVNGYFDPGKTVAYPSDVNETILARFGPAPDKKTADPFDAVVGWAQRVLREYVLPELRPDVVIDWITEPDHTQHAVGVGSPAARHAIRHADREIAAVLAMLDPASTDVFVVSDHGFTTNTCSIDVTGALVDAGLKASADSADVVLASSGQAVAVHVTDGDVAAIARFVQSQDWGGVLFTRERAPGDPRGTVDGTFALQLIHLTGPDLVFTFPWTSNRRVRHRCRDARAERQALSQRPRQHESVERAQHVFRVGRRLQIARDDRRARGQRGRGADDPGAARTGRRQRARRPRAARGTRERSGRGSGRG